MRSLPRMKIATTTLIPKATMLSHASVGPFRNRRHNSVSDVYADIFEEAGAYVRQEVFVPEFSRGDAEAWLDVWGFGLPELPDCLVDVTVRHPFLDRYQPAANRIAGSTARAAEKEKKEKYPASGGRCVWPAAHETWGRLCTGAKDILLRCAAAATRRARIVEAVLRALSCGAGVYSWMPH